MLLDLHQLCGKYGIVPKGIIHIGAHEGHEMFAYLRMKADKVLFIEANPAVFARLQSNVQGYPHFKAVNCAVANYNGTTVLHVTSFDMSSSILPLKYVTEIYPHIKKVDGAVVPCKTLDSLMREFDMPLHDYNIINIDIQGAELLAFEGATETLKHIEAILTEVNYEELYEGCALSGQLDAFLNMYEFERKETHLDHPTWGDAFYIKQRVNTESC